MTFLAPILPELREIFLNPFYHTIPLSKTCNGFLLLIPRYQPSALGDFSSQYALAMPPFCSYSPGAPNTFLLLLLFASQKILPTLQNPPSRSHQIPLFLCKTTELYKCCRKKWNTSGKTILLDEGHVQNVVEDWKTDGRDSFESYIQLLYQHRTLLKLLIIQNLFPAPTP